jgi:hypothetical protein
MYRKCFPVAEPVEKVADYQPNTRFNRLSLGWYPDFEKAFKKQHFFYINITENQQFLS